ncbi:hypothetical protein KUTeg_009144 [Tegillarca granosa]|uniref:Uncharacterized protein n=1 Tax=Tegillarca granosa TaxID=220873 RepID=A0ABQ9F7J9_TEGGR|nr:hypothetical protein KUTeg_009144 [Tegillarca granosa]
MASTIQSKSTTIIPPAIAGPTMPMIKICYGQRVQDWLHSGSGPKAFDVSTFKEPDNITFHCPNPFGCFLNRTLVLMKDGSQKEIESISENENIIGMDSVIGTVSSEKVSNFTQGQLVVFGFNNEEPFFTASHPFMTDQGWMALNPFEARKENNWLDVGQLKEGQYVKKIEEFDKTTGSIRYQRIKIESIQSKTYPAGTPIYGLHLREGPRSYHANGYLVHLNYPEITSDRIKKGISNLSILELEKFVTTIKSFGPCIEKILGPGAAAVLETFSENHSIFQTEVDEHISGFKKARNNLPLNEVVALDMHVQSASDKELPKDLQIPNRISLIKGLLYLEGIHMKSIKQLDSDTIFWERTVHASKLEFGLLKFNHHRSLCTGVISIGNSSDDSNAELIPFYAKIRENVYNCYVIEDQGQQHNCQIGSSREEIGKLIMGYEDINVIGKIQILPNMDEPDDLEHSVIFFTGDDNCFHVKVDIPNEYRETLGYVELSATFEYDFSGFHGKAIPFDPLASDNRGKPKTWIGEFKDQGISMSLVGKSFLDCIDQEGVNLPRISDAMYSPIMVNMLQTVNTLLSLSDLFMLDTPDNSLVHKTTTDMLIQAVKYDLDDDTRSNVLGITKPILDPQLREIAQNHTQFLGDNFGTSYLLQGLSQCKSMEDHFSQDDRNKLLYYWNANDEGCLSTNKDYSKLNTDISRVAFFKLVPRLQFYIDDGGEKWAKTLYDKLTSKSVMNGLIVQSLTDQGRAIINKQTMVLLCLCPEKDYYLKFHQKIVESKLQTLMQYFNTTKKGADEVKDFIQDTIRQLIIMVENDSDQLSSDIKKELMDQIHDVQEELKVESTEALMTRMGSFVTEILNMMAEMKGTVWKNFTQAVGQLLKKISPKVGKFLGNIVSMTYDEVVRNGTGEMIEENVPEGESASEAIAEAVTEDENVATRVTRFRTFLNVSDAIVEALNIVALTACAVVIGFQIARDFQTGAPVYKKVLDIIQGVCIGIQLGCSVIGLAVESTVIAAIGTVCAVIGVVMAIVCFILGFVEKPKPKPTPAETFVAGKGKKFLDSLPKPSQKWLDDYNERKKKTEENMLARQAKPIHELFEAFIGYVFIMDFKDQNM